MLNIGARLRRLRKEKDVRINALAEHLGVDPREIDSWERGESFPPIGLLPKIAVYFETTTDELLCMDSFSDDDYARELTAEYRRLIADNHISQAADKMRTAVKAHPKNWRFKVMLQYALYLLCDQPNMIRWYASELKQLHDEIIAGCPDDTIRAESRRLYAMHLWTDLGAGDEAVGEIMKLPGRVESRQSMLPSVTEGETRRRHLKENIFDAALDAARDIMSLADSGAEGTDAEKEEILGAAAGVLSAVVPSGDSGTLSAPLCRAWLKLAEHRCLAGDTESALSAFEKAVDYAVIFDGLPETYTHVSSVLGGTAHRKRDMESSPLTLYISETVLRTQWASSLMYEAKMTGICQRLGRAANQVRAEMDSEKRAREERINARAEEKRRNRAEGPMPEADGEERGGAEND